MYENTHSCSSSLKTIFKSSTQSLTRMETKAGDQCKCMQILHGIPAKILNRARDFFTEKMVVSATGHGGPSVGGPGAQASCLIENASVDSTKSSTSNDEKSKEAVHLVSKEGSQDGSNVKQYCNMACGEKPRSYSLRLGTIGRIDEERPCSFKEREGMAANLCPRSRSVAIMRAPVN